MPCAFVVSTGTPRDSYTDEARDQIRRASQDQGDGGTETKGLYNRWKEVLEAVRRQMHVVHKAEDPSTPVGGSLSKALPYAGVLATAGGINEDSVVGELAFFLCEEPSLEWAVGEKPESRDRDSNRNSALNDK